MHSLLSTALSLSATLALLALFLYYRRRQHRREQRQNRALFEQRRRQHNQQAPAQLSPLEWAERQLADWQRLLAELEATQADPKQLRYCRQQIKRFEQEVAFLRRS